MPPKRGLEAQAGQPASKAARAASGAAKSDAKGAAPASVDIEDFNFSASEQQQIRGGLLAWYDANHRVLPWRRNPHSKLGAEQLAAAAASGQAPAPLDLSQNDFIYFVWVCEIMSQQTQVSRAAEYFRRWVAKWPTVQSLAAASQEEVNEVWAGLGYYRRARFLLEGAKYIAGERGGAFPTTAKELQAIPGVGAYTSAAIASIACGERSAVVDGNVIRVLARLRRVAGDPRSGAMTKLWAELADSLLDPTRPGDFNQAVMELGATVCVPNTEPKCGECPVSASCAAFQAAQAFVRGGGDLSAAGPPRVTDYPTKVEKAEKREETVAVAVVQLVPPGGGHPGSAPAAGRFLLVQRPSSGLLAGLWQFPLLPLAGEGPAGVEEQRQLMDEHLEAMLGMQLLKQGREQDACGSAGSGVVVLERQPLGQVVHIFSHIRMVMKVERIMIQGNIDVLPRVADEAAGVAALQWVPAGEMEGKGLSSGVKKVFKLFTDARSKAGSKQSITAFFKPAGAATVSGKAAGSAAKST